MTQVPAQRDALRAHGYSNDDIDRIPSEQVDEFLRYPPEWVRDFYNGGGSALEPDRAAPSSPPEHRPPASEPQPKPGGGGSALEPDRDQLEIFVDGMFRHCGHDGFVSLRAFYENEDKRFRIIPISLAGGLPFLMDAAEDDARRAANHPKPVVFCPPIAVFASKERAREQDLLEAPVFSVELDQNPRAALATLERLLGPATFVVRSGGVWMNPVTGEAEDKLHAHWRLKRPARGEDIAKLKQLRKLATALVGGDPSNVPACHPIRWPGSWHRKATPRLCEIISPTDHLDNEINLDTALEILQKAVGNGPLAARASGSAPESSDVGNVSSKFARLPLEVLGGDIPGASLQADPDLIASALAVIPNSKRLLILRGLKIDGSEDDDLDWHYWNAIGMATWNATSGTPEGKAAFHAFSKKSPKYNAQTTDERWAAYFRSPPTRIGAGTIFWLADQAAPGWRQEYEARKSNGQGESGGGGGQGVGGAGGSGGGGGDGGGGDYGGDGPGPQPDPGPSPSPQPGAQPGLFDPWQEFIVPPFPLDILPGVAHEFVVTKSTAMGADPSALAMAELAAFSGAIHHRFRVKMMENNDWYEHVRLWVLLFGRPSWLKSPIMDAVLRPIRLREGELRRDYEAQLRTWKAQHKGKNADGLGDGEEKPEQPERLLVGDITTEMLCEVMSRSNRGSLAEHDELAGWIGRMERYHSGGKGASTDRAFYLRCWSGGPYTYDRKNSGEIRVPNASLSILGGIQPRRMDELQDLTSDGLLQRFLTTLMQAPKKPQDIDCAKITSAYTRLMYELLELPAQKFQLTSGPGGAAEAMAELQHDLFSLERVGAAIAEGFEGHIGKLKAYAGILAIILHLIDNPAEAIRQGAIGKPVVEKVGRLIKEFLLPHAHEFYSRCQGEGEQLRTIASYVLTCGKNRIRLADLTNNVRFCRGKTVLEINKQVSPLVAGDWLAPVEQSPVCRAWRVNRAAIDQQFAARMTSERESKRAIVELLRARRHV